MGRERWTLPSARLSSSGWIQSGLGVFPMSKARLSPAPKLESLSSPDLTWLWAQSSGAGCSSPLVTRKLMPLPQAQVPR